MDIADGQVSLLTTAALDGFLQGHPLLALEEIEQRLAGHIVGIGKFGFAAIEHNELIYYYCITILLLNFNIIKTKCDLN